MAEQIYHLNEQGQLAPMSEEPFEQEGDLQELVSRFPKLLSGEQINPENRRPFVLVDRKQGIADIVGGSSRWRLDHLLIDQDAIPTLVETKRQGNPEIRRSIVGQMMEYAAHATQTWDVAEIRRTLEDRIRQESEDPRVILATLLETDEPDIDGFWQRVETNLRAARLRLLFVADGIPDELARIVEFLNEQMPGIEVLAVEIKQFPGETGNTIVVPKVIGRTAEAISRTSARSSGRGSGSFNEQAFVESFADENAQEAARRILEVAHRHEAVLNGDDRGVRIRGNCSSWGSPIRVAWLYSPGVKGLLGAEGFVFGAGNGPSDFFEQLPFDLKTILEEWIAEFQNLGVYFSSPAQRMQAIPHQVAAANIDLLCERLDRVLRELSDLQPEES